MKARTLTQEQVKRSFEYSPETGVLQRIERDGKRYSGNLDDKGYIVLYLGKVRFLAHRIAWALMTGNWPDSPLDHIDGNRANNKWANLRKATPSQNMRNSATKRTVHNLPRGVVPVRQKTPSFRARIQVNKRNIDLGVYPTPEEASEMYQLAADMLHGDFAYHRGQGSQAAQGGEHGAQ